MNPSTSNNKVNVYQIDFTAVASGKRIASSKRRVRWRFGFANPEALAAGETGTACRGEEHDVTLVWSVTSGKRLILADGQEVHYSNSRSPIFDFSWTMRGNHVLKIVAHASPPMSPTPGWRQYDFFVDGQSFFIFPKVYRLGLAPNDPRAAQGARNNNTRLAERGERYTTGPPGAAAGAGGKSEIANLEAPSNPHEEEAYLQEAIRQSLKDDKTAAAGGGSGGGGGGDLLDFGSAPALPPSTTAAPAAADPGMFGAPALPPSTTATAPYAAAPAAPAAYSYAPQPAAPLAALPAPVPAAAAANPYAPQPVAAPSFAAAPVPPPVQTGGLEGLPPQQFVTPQAQQTPSSIGFSSPPADVSGFTPQPPPAAAAPAPVAAEPAAPAPAAAAQPTLTMNTLSGEEGLLGGTNSATTSGSMADQAYAKLVNMDTFSLGNPSSQTTKRDNPFENAAANSVVGGTQSLADLQSKKDSSSSSGTKEVMKAAPDALVVSSTQNGSWGGQYGGAMQQQPQMGYGGRMQPQQQPMYGGGMQQPQMGYGGGMQQPAPAFGQQQQPPPLGGGMGGPPPLQQPGFGGGFGQPQQPPAFGYGQPQQQPGAYP